MRQKRLLIGVILCAVGAFMLYDAYTASQNGTPASSSPEDFLAKVHKRIARDPDNVPEGVGDLPPMEGDQSLVAVIKLEPEQLDFGTIANDKFAYREVKIHNTGKADLEIKDLQNSCGCTASVVDKDIVAPGDFATIRVSFNPKKLAGFEAKRTVTILSNSKENPRLVLPITLKIDPEFSVTPDELDFGDIQRGEAALATIVMRQLTDKQEIILKKLTEPRGIVKNIGVSYSERPKSERADPDKHEYEIVVSLPENLSVGPLRSSFYMETNCERFPKLLIPIKANVVSFYTVEPARVSFGRIAPGAEKASVLKVSGVDNAKITVSDVSVDLEGILLEMRASADSNVVEFDLKIDENAPIGYKRGELKFSIASGDKKFSETLSVTCSVGKPRPRSAARPGISPAARQPVRSQQKS